MPPNKRPPRPAIKVLTALGIPPKSKPALPPASNPTGVAKKGIGKKGVRTDTKAYEDFAKKNPLPESDAPREMTVPSVHKHTMKVLKEYKTGKLTENTLLGRFWESIAHKMKHSQKYTESAIKEAIEMLEEFRQKYHSETGFLNGNGDLITLSTKELKLLDSAILSLKNAAMSNLNALQKAGLVYVDRFKIGSNQYKDGAFILMLEKHTIVLVNIEAKTKYSGGVIAQSGTFLVRLAAAKPGEAISLMMDDVEIFMAREQLLFNPMWLHSQVAIKEANADLARFYNKRNPEELTKELRRRLASQKKRLLTIPPKERANFLGANLARGNNIARLVVPSYVIYSDTNLRGLRRYFEKFIETERRK